MHGPLDHAAMVHHAHVQAQHGQRLLANHIPDGTGCCRECGRSHPCPDRLMGEELLIRFAGWSAVPAPRQRGPSLEPYRGRVSVRTIRDLALSVPDLDPDDDLDTVDGPWDEALGDAVVGDVAIEGLVLTGLSIVDVLFTGTDLSGATLSGVRLRGCRFDNVDLASARFERVTMDTCEFQGCRLTGLTLVDTTVSNVLVENSRLDYSTWDRVRTTGPLGLLNSTLADASLVGCELGQAALAECVLTRTELEDCDLRGTDLRGNDLRGIVGVASLYGAVLGRDQLPQLASALARDLHIDVR
jgi:uncharacterized protein YjbI with pentapeptide repeats